MRKAPSRGSDRGPHPTAGSLSSTIRINAYNQLLHTDVPQAVSKYAPLHTSFASKTAALRRPSFESLRMAELVLGIKEKGYVQG